MAHEVEQMFSVGQVPWHGLGNVIQEAPTIKEGIKLAGLDWKVQTEPLFTDYSEQVTHQAVRRMDNREILGVVGPSWHPLQNNESFEFFQPFVESGLATLETAGSLKDGKIVWVLAKLNMDTQQVGDDDVISPYLLLSNSHDGSRAVKVAFTPIRVVCANTLACSDNTYTSAIKITHHANVKSNLDDLQGAVNLIKGGFEANLELYKKLKKTQICQADLEKFVQVVFRPDVRSIDQIKRPETFNKNVLMIQELMETGRGSDLKNTSGTAWGLYNAYTEYLSHNAQKTDDMRYYSLWFDENKRKNTKALNYLEKLVA